MKRAAFTVFVLLVLPQISLAQEYDPNYLGTFSIIGRDAETGELGMGVQSKAFAAGNRAMHAKGGLVVIAHQAAANPMYGGIGVELLQAGYSPEEALEMMVSSDEGRDRRQVAILDNQGRTAAWTGSGASDWKGHKCGKDYCAQGNILTGPEVVDAMAAHHMDIDWPSLESMLVQAADAISAARPGARRDILESYIKRLEKLEGIADSFNGVSKAFALQAGREIRIMVESEKISDEEAVWLSKDIAKRVENELEYPGQIKVTVIRETRAVDYAR